MNFRFYLFMVYKEVFLVSQNQTNKSVIFAGIQSREQSFGFRVHSNTKSLRRCPVADFLQGASRNQNLGSRICKCEVENKGKAQKLRLPPKQNKQNWSLYCLFHLNPQDWKDKGNMGAWSADPLPSWGNCRKYRVLFFQPWWLWLLVLGSINISSVNRMDHHFPP